MNELFDEELFQQYELLLPSRFEGGYLIIALYQRVKNRDLPEAFTTDDIKRILEEIALAFNQPTPHSERIIKSLLHYFLRKSPDEYGVYNLTDHANRLVELIIYKIHNPYKNYPLRESFDKYFITRFKDIKSITDLELKFGSEFVAGHKRIINDHLESLEDELNEAYSRLKTILHSDELDTTTLVKQFVNTFKTFGDRAEDISSAIASKDSFLKMLRTKVDLFYNLIADCKHPESDHERKEYSVHQDNWKRANLIYKDLDWFFQNVDYKISGIRKRILSASDKLSELQNNFAAHSNFRLLIKKLFLLALEVSHYEKEGLKIDKGFPLKQVIGEKLQFFYPGSWEFVFSRKNVLIDIPPDEEYEQQQRNSIENEIRRQEIINLWVEVGKQRLSSDDVDLNSIIDEIGTSEQDLMIAVHTAIDLVQYASEHEKYSVEIIEKNMPVKESIMQIWKMKLLNNRPITTS